jgi:peptidyl-tRNA hydrolase
MGDIDFVLSKFTTKEKEELPMILNNITRTIEEKLSK